MALTLVPKEGQDWKENDTTGKKMTRLENGFILVIEPQVWVSIERIWGYLVLRLIKITKDPILILLFTCLS